MEYQVHPFISVALRFLAGACDGARSRDGVGFSAAETHTGRAWGLALARGELISPDEQEAAIAFLPKYKKQLDGVADFPPTEEMVVFLEEQRKLWDEEYEEIQAAQQYARSQEVAAALSAARSRCCKKPLKSTYPPVLEALFYLDEVGVICADFYDSLIARVEGGQDLTLKQQKAFLSTIERHEHHLVEAGIAIANEQAIDEYISESEAIASANPMGSIVLRGRKLVVEFGFSAEFHSRIKSIIQELRLKAGGCWNPDKKIWEMPIFAADKLISSFPEFEVGEGVVDAYKSLIDDDQAERLIGAKRAQELIDLCRLDDPLPNGWMLRPFQKEGVARLITIAETTGLKGALFADDMGLGKTVQALVTAKAYQQKFDVAVFVVCPSSLKDNWLREAGYVGLNIEVFSWAKIPSPLEHREYILLADEAHYAQSGSKSQRGKNFLALSRHPNCKLVVPMSGTPIKNGRPINLLPLLQAIDHPLSRNIKHYQSRYCDAKATRFCAWDVTGASHLDELAKEIQDHLIRRKKKDVLADLPDKTRVFRQAEPTGERLANWKQAIAEAKAEYDRGDEGAALVLMTKLRVAASYAKFETTQNIVEESLSQGVPPIVFTEFLDTAKDLKSHFAAQGYKVELLIGDVKTEDRQPMVDRFQAGEADIFISTSKAGGVGITLTRSSTVIMHDRPWTPGDAEQCEDRAYRIGQQNNVLCIWVQWSAIDEKVDSILAEKADRIELILKGKRKTMRGIKHPNDIVLELLGTVLNVKGGAKIAA